jgi:hypothetical protein
MVQQNQDMTDQDAYLPTEEEIAKQCELIRSKWSKREHMKRMNGAYQNPQADVSQCAEPNGIRKSGGTANWIIK